MIDNGVSVQSSPSTTIRGNKIGTNAAGTASAGGGGSFAGVQVVASQQTVIGGAGAGEGNVISGNGGSGIRIQSDTAVDGAGISVSAEQDRHLGRRHGRDRKRGQGRRDRRGDRRPARRHDRAASAPGQANTIASNGAAGVFVLASASTGIVIRGNAIYGNGGIPIDLGGDGVTANDVNDVDTGPNGRQNFPVLANAVQDGAGTVAVDLVSRDHAEYSYRQTTRSTCTPAPRAARGSGSVRPTSPSASRERPRAACPTRRTSGLRTS